MNQATAKQQHKDEKEVIGQEFQKLPGYVSPWSCSSRTTLAGDAAGVCVLLLASVNVQIMPGDYLAAVALTNLS